MKPWTVLSLLEWTASYFEKQGILAARLDAEVLLAFLLGLSRIQLYLQFERSMKEDELKAFKALISRRVQWEPVSYICGTKEFWSLPFNVGPGVLIPRPDTEVLVENVVRRSPFVACEEGIKILDIGTGCGNIAIALAKEFPKAQIIAIDISREALGYAAENAKMNQVDSQIEFWQEDFFTSDPRRRVGHLFDLIVSNPPYIPTSVLPTLDRGIKNFEPLQALDGGSDGLDFYRRIGEFCQILLKPEGFIAVEIGEDQARAVVEIFEKRGLKEIEVNKDYAGLPRGVLAQGIGSTLDT